MNVYVLSSRGEVKTLDAQLTVLALDEFKQLDVHCFFSYSQTWIEKN